jgi:transcriptional antiterminator NusG
MTEVEEKKWYVIRAVSGQESKIKEYILSEIDRLGYSNMVEDLLVPTQKNSSNTKWKKNKQREDLFSRIYNDKGRSFRRSAPYY